MRSQLVVAVSHVADADLSSGFVGGVGLVAIAALVLGGIGMVVGFTRHHRKAQASRAEQTARAATAVVAAEAARSATVVLPSATPVSLPAQLAQPSHVPAPARTSS